ncbi:hypothetical protein [Streptomyces viridosporus]|nr:hypothetical protein [Streptomyces viridosporus]
MTQPTVYRIEFGPAWPVPPITVDFADRNAAARQVAEYAIPYLRPVLAAKGHPEMADCFFRTDRDLTVGEFVYLDLSGGETGLSAGARFCPARLTPTDLDPEICGDEYDADVCDLEPGHDGDHCADATVGWTNRYARPTTEETR